MLRSKLALFDLQSVERFNMDGNFLSKSIGFIFFQSNENIFIFVPTLFKEFRRFFMIFIFYLLIWQYLVEVWADSWLNFLLFSQKIFNLLIFWQKEKVFIKRSKLFEDGSILVIFGWILRHFYDFIENLHNKPGVIILFFFENILTVLIINKRNFVQVDEIFFRIIDHINFRYDLFHSRSSSWYWSLRIAICQIYQYIFHNIVNFKNEVLFQ